MIRSDAGRVCGGDGEIGTGARPVGGGGYVAEQQYRPGNGLEIAELAEATDILQIAYAKEHGQIRVITHVENQ